MSTFPTLTQPAAAKDLIRWEADDAGRFTRTSAVITNDTGAAIAEGAVGVGYPLKEAGGVWSPALDSQEGAVDGVLVDERIVPALANGEATTTEYAILSRGPAVLNKGQIETTDVADATMDIDALETRLLALDIKLMQAPAQTETAT